jgi:hypothetical protein
MFAGSEKDQVAIITTHFRNMFSIIGEKDKMQTIPPAKMDKPFTSQEIERAARGMKNNKSPGIDNINAEYVKYAPNEIHLGIADILNETAATGKYPAELKISLLTPLPKPGKKQGPQPT